MRKPICQFISALALITLLLVAQLAQAKRKNIQEVGPDNQTQSTSTDTTTWWCLNLNDLLHVNVPVVVGLGFLVVPDPAPFPTACTPTAFPVPVPNHSRFVAGGLQIWYTNKTYPPVIRDILAADGYKSSSNSPEEDFRAKLDEIKVEIKTFPDNTLVATFYFDPRKNFRLLQYRDVYEAFGPPEPVEDSAAGLFISSDEISRMPLLIFPGEVGPVSPGQYRAFVYWHLTETHNDGMGVSSDNFLPAGWTLYGSPRFVVTP